MAGLRGEEQTLRGRGGGDWTFREYMQIKNEKLRNQHRTSTEQVSDLFVGVTAYINGYTDPPAEELRRLLAMHGGNYVIYYKRTAVTHMIASNLCGAKLKDLNNQLVVRPEWLLDSIKQGKRLPVADYLLYHREGPNQQSITSMMGKQGTRKPVWMEEKTTSGHPSLRLKAESGTDGHEGPAASFTPSSAPQKESDHHARHGDLEDDSSEEDCEFDAFERQWLSETKSAAQDSATSDHRELISDSEELPGTQVDTSTSDAEKFDVVGVASHGRDVLEQPGSMDLNSVQAVASDAHASVEHERHPDRHVQPEYVAAESSASPSKHGEMFEENYDLPQSQDLNSSSQSSNSRAASVSPQRRAGSTFGSAAGLKEWNHGSASVGPMETKSDLVSTRQSPNQDPASSVTNTARRTSTSYAPASPFKAVKKLTFDPLSTSTTKSAASITPTDDQASVAPLHDPRLGGLSVNTSGGNAQFMQQFYQQSRLHHLSTSGQQAKQMVRRMKEEARKQGRRVRPFSKADDPGRVIVHIDLDAFFVSVGLTSRPELKDKPVALAHSSNKEGSSEISSCNYVARQYGIHNGMLMRSAKSRCPELQVIPYEFDKYKEFSQRFYEILAKHTLCIQGVSIDEAYLDLTDVAAPSSTSSPAQPQTPPAERVVGSIRREIEESLGIQASAGIGPNILLARLATRKAKPDGQVCAPFDLSREVPLHAITEENDAACAFVGDLDVGDLPGVGRVTGRKLQEAGIETCRQLREKSLEQLRSMLGPGNGKQLYLACRGRDDRVLKENEVPRSVSVEISWGVRFVEDDQVKQFVRNMACEVTRRLKATKRLSQRATLKVKVRKPNAGQPYKMLGHGPCNDVNRVINFSRPTDDEEPIISSCLGMLEDMKVPPVDVRGVGISLHKLCDMPPSGDTVARTSSFSIEKFLQKPREQEQDSSLQADRRGGNSTESAASPTARSAAVNRADIPPSAVIAENAEDDPLTLSQIDPAVLQELPDYIREEVRQHYQRKRQSGAAAADPRPSVETSNHTSSMPANASDDLPAQPALPGGLVTRNGHIGSAGSKATAPSSRRAVKRKAEASKTKRAKRPALNSGVGRNTRADDKMFRQPAPVAQLSHTSTNTSAGLSSRDALETAAGISAQDWQELPSPSQWSAEVLEQLPASVVKELKAQLVQRRAEGTKPAGREGTLSDGTSASTRPVASAGATGQSSAAALQPLPAESQPITQGAFMGPSNVKENSNGARRNNRNLDPALPSPSQLDTSVMEELPSEVRREIDAAYRLAERRKAQAAAAGSPPLHARHRRLDRSVGSSSTALGNGTRGISAGDDYQFRVAGYLGAGSTSRGHGRAEGSGMVNLCSHCQTTRACVKCPACVDYSDDRRHPRLCLVCSAVLHREASKRHHVPQTIDSIEERRQRETFGAVLALSAGEQHGQKILQEQPDMLFALRGPALAESSQDGDSSGTSLFRPTLCGAVSLATVSGLLKDWTTEQPEGPTLQQAEAVRDYLLDLVQYKADDAFTALRAFRRHCRKSAHPMWVRVFNHILEMVQNEYRLVFRSQLPVRGLEMDSAQSDRSEYDS